MLRRLTLLTGLGLVVGLGLAAVLLSLRFWGVALHKLKQAQPHLT